MRFTSCKPISWICSGVKLVVVRERATHAIDYCGLDAVVNLFL